MKNTTQNSAAFKQHMATGRAISKQLDPLLTQRQVAAKLGISYEAVRRIEYRALSKIASRIKLKML